MSESTGKDPGGGPLEILTRKLVFRDPVLSETGAKLSEGQVWAQIHQFGNPGDRFRALSDQRDASADLRVPRAHLPGLFSREDQVDPRPADNQTVSHCCSSTISWVAANEIGGSSASRDRD